MRKHPHGARGGLLDRASRASSSHPQIAEAKRLEVTTSRREEYVRDDVLSQRAFYVGLKVLLDRLEPGLVGDRRGGPVEEVGPVAGFASKASSPVRPRR
jgi:hypothetical protein